MSEIGKHKGKILVGITTGIAALGIGSCNGEYNNAQQTLDQLKDDYTASERVLYISDRLDTSARALFFRPDYNEIYQVVNDGNNVIWGSRNVPASYPNPHSSRQVISDTLPFIEDDSVSQALQKVQSSLPDESRVLTNNEGFARERDSIQSIRQEYIDNQPFNPYEVRLVWNGIRNKQINAFLGMTAGSIVLIVNSCFAGYYALRRFQQKGVNS